MRMDREGPIRRHAAGAAEERADGQAARSAGPVDRVGARVRGDRVLQVTLRERVRDTELQVLRERDLRDRHLEQHLARHDVDALQDVEDELVVALGGENDERVRHLVGDDPDLFLEDRLRPLRLAGYAGAGLPPRKRDADHALAARTGSPWRARRTGGATPAAGAADSASAEAPLASAGSPTPPMPPTCC